MPVVGVSTLVKLKARLLAPGLRGGTDFDSVVTILGDGVADSFDGYCNRKLRRASGAIDEFSADRESWVLLRYPVETITTVQTRSDTGSWTTQTSLVQQQALESGVMQFTGQVGPETTRIRVTYTGGYWVNDDGTQPSGSTEMPDDIVEAWMEQCKNVWDKVDPLGKSLTGQSGGRGGQFLHNTIGALDLATHVKKMLMSHKRYCLT